MLHRMWSLIEERLRFWLYKVPTSMGSEVLQHRSIEEVSVIYAAFEVPKVTHSFFTIHEDSLGPKPYANVYDALRIQPRTSVDCTSRYTFRGRDAEDEYRQANLHTFSLLGVT